MTLYEEPGVWQSPALSGQPQFVNNITSHSVLFFFPPAISQQVILPATVRSIIYKPVGLMRSP